MVLTTKNVFTDDRHLSHEGSAIYIEDPNDGKYFFILGFVDTPSFAKTYNTYEVNISTSGTISKGEAKATIDDAEGTILCHRDNFLKFKKFVTPGMHKFLSINPDLTATQVYSTVRLSAGDSGTDTDVKTLKTSFTPSYISDEVILNCRDMLKDTAFFMGGIPESITISVGDTQQIGIVTKQLPGSVATTITSTVDTTGICTATYATGKLAIEGVKPGTAMITLSSSALGYAGDLTTIIVNVKA